MGLALNDRRKLIFHETKKLIRFLSTQRKALFVQRFFFTTASYCVHFWTNALGNGMNPHSYGLNGITAVLLQGWLWHLITPEGWYAIKQRNQTKPIWARLYLYSYLSRYVSQSISLAICSNAFIFLSLSLSIYIYIYTHTGCPKKMYTHFK